MILQRKATGRIRTLEVYTTIPFTYTFFYYLRKIYFSKLLNHYFVPYITVIYTCFFSRVCITEGWKNLPNIIILGKFQADGMHLKFISQLDSFLEIDYSKIDFQPKSQPKSSLLYSTSFFIHLRANFRQEVECIKLNFGQKSILLYSISKKESN